jgi:hypothetical protein
MLGGQALEIGLGAHPKMAMGGGIQGDDLASHGDHSNKKATGE